MSYSYSHRVTSLTQMQNDQLIANLLLLLLFLFNITDNELSLV